MAQLAERLLLTTEISGLNPFIAKVFDCLVGFGRKDENKQTGGWAREKNKGTVYFLDGRPRRNSWWSWHSFLSKFLRWSLY